MSKKVAKIVKIQFPAGEAKPGPGLAGAGIAMPKFCQEFNDRTRDRAGEVVPVVISVFEDKSFEFVLKTTPSANLLKKVAKISKAASTPGKEVVATISEDELRKIAEYKMPDLNANDVEAAMRIIEGTARNMGINIEK